MRTALMCLVISHLQNGDAGNEALGADEGAGSMTGPRQLRIVREPSLGSLSLARRRRRDASGVRADPPPEAAA